MDIYLYVDKKDSSPSYRSIMNNKIKRKSPELSSYSGIEIFQYLSYVYVKFLFLKTRKHLLVMGNQHDRILMKDQFMIQVIILKKKLILKCLVYLEPPVTSYSTPMNQQISKSSQNGNNDNSQRIRKSNWFFSSGASHRPERFTPSEVAAFVRGIDPSFDSLAARFLQEVFIRRNLKKQKS